MGRGQTGTATNPRRPMTPGAEEEAEERLQGKREETPDVAKPVHVEITASEQVVVM